MSRLWMAAALNALVLLLLVGIVIWIVHDDEPVGGFSVPPEMLPPVPDPEEEILPGIPLDRQAFEQGRRARANIDALLKWSTTDPASVGLLREMLADLARAETHFEREGALWGLGGLGPEAPEEARIATQPWLAPDKRASTRAAAVTTDARLRGSPAAAVEYLVSLLEHEEQHTRDSAMRGLRLLGPHAAPAVGALAARLAHRDDVFVAAETLEAIGVAAQPALPALIRALELVQYDGLETSTVLETIRIFGPSAEDALPAIRALIKEHPATTEFGAAARAAWWSIEPDSEQARDAVFTSLEEGIGSFERDCLLTAFEHGGAHVQATMPRIVRLLAASDEAVRDNGFAILQWMESHGAAAKPALLEILKSNKDEVVRSEAARTLGCVAGRDPEVQRALLARLKTTGDAAAAGAFDTAKVGTPEIIAAVERARANEANPDRKRVLETHLRRIRYHASR